MKQYLLSKNLKLLDAYPANFLNYNLKYLEKLAKKKGYNLYNALIVKVDSQSKILDKIKGMELILNNLIN